MDYKPEETQFVQTYTQKRDELVAEVSSLEKNIAIQIENSNLLTKNANEARDRRIIEEAKITILKDNYITRVAEYSSQMDELTKSIGLATLVKDRIVTELSTLESSIGIINTTAENLVTNLNQISNTISGTTNEVKIIKKEFTTLVTDVTREITQFTNSVKHLTSDVISKAQDIAKRESELSILATNLEQRDRDLKAWKDKTEQEFKQRFENLTKPTL